MAAAESPNAIRNALERKVDMDHLRRMPASARGIFAFVRQSRDAIGKTHKVLADLDRYLDACTHHSAPRA